MQGLAPGLVAYAGSVSKTLAPGLRLGWLVAPERLAGDVVSAKASDDLGTPVVEQLALADFLERGESPPWEHASELLEDGLIDVHFALTPRGHRALARA